MAALDALLAEVRDIRVDASEDFMRDVMQQAADVAAERQPVAAGGAPSGILPGLWAALGGWTGAGGLAAATAVGVWFGIAPPSALDPLNTAIFGESTAVSLFATDDVLGLEG